MKLALALTATLLLGASSGIPQSPSTPGAEVYIISPADGDRVSSPVRVVFGLRGMGIAPAGVEREGTGHHHLLIDTELPAMDAPMPAIPGELIHYGGGQTEAEVEMPTGVHTLRLVLGDHLHIPHDPPVISEPITITVQ